MSSEPTWKDLKIERREAHAMFAIVRSIVIDTNKTPIEAWFEIFVDLLKSMDIL
jgi:hypothetical protein